MNLNFNFKKYDKFYQFQYFYLKTQFLLLIKKYDFLFQKFIIKMHINNIQQLIIYTKKYFILLKK